MIGVQVDRKADMMTPVAINIETDEVRPIGESTSYQQFVNEIRALGGQRAKVQARDQEQER